MCKKGLTKAQLYDVLVKRKQLKKGKGSYVSRGYKKANKIPLTKVAALGLGASIVDTYTNRSFRIRRSKKKRSKSSQQNQANLEAKWRLLKQKFRAQKKNPKVLVEKSTHAIDSFQEKLGIPYESQRLRKAGLLTVKKKRRSRRNKWI
jgi:hypothetical protein